MTEPIIEHPMNGSSRNGMHPNRLHQKRLFLLQRGLQLSCNKLAHSNIVDGVVDPEFYLSFFMPFDNEDFGLASISVSNRINSPSSFADLLLKVPLVFDLKNVTVLCLL